MPHISFNRRQFLKSSLYTTASVLAMRYNSSAAENEKIARWAFCSDTHVPADPTNEYRGFHPYENMAQLTPALLEATPEGVVITGDLARLEGLPGDYANLKRFIDPLAESMPVCLALGNHDHRDNFTKYFNNLKVDRQPVEGKYVLDIELPQIRFLILDSLLYVNKVAGLLGKNQRTWLEEYLQSVDNRPILLFFHHTLSDGDGDLLDVERLFRIVKPVPKVKGIVYGHSHVYNFDVREGIHLINLPAVGYNFRDSEPTGWVEAQLTTEGADFTLHALGGNRGKDGQSTSLEWRS